MFEQISWPEALKTIRDSKDSIDKKWAFIYGLGETHTGMLGNSWPGTSKDVISSTDQIAAELIQHFENRNLSALDTFTDAQDRESSIVYGMPKAAAQIGAATDILPAKMIGRAISDFLLAKKEKAL